MEKMGLLWDLKIMDVREEIGQSIIVLLDLIYFNFQSIEIVILIASEDNVAEFLLLGHFWSSMFDTCSLPLTNTYGIWLFTYLLKG